MDLSLSLFIIKCQTNSKSNIITSYLKLPLPIFNSSKPKKKYTAINMNLSDIRNPLHKLTINLSVNHQPNPAINILKLSLIKNKNLKIKSKTVEKSVLTLNKFKNDFTNHYFLTDKLSNQKKRSTKLLNHSLQLKVFTTNL
jgi:hypothetical protein